MASQPPSQPPSKQGLKKWWNAFSNQRKSQDIVPAPSGIFGVPLRTSIQYANVAISLLDENGKSYIYGYVPIVVAKCGVFLKEKAMDVQGIFRLAGAEKRIKELKAEFDTPDRYGKGLVWDGYTVHDAANVLRRYLNELPEPIVPLNLYERFRDPLRSIVRPQANMYKQQGASSAGSHASTDQLGPQGTEHFPPAFDRQAAIRTYQQLITELPPLNRQLLLYILDLLAVFASKQEVNLMTPSNLSAIFQPCMLYHPKHEMEPREYLLNQDVVIFLIEQQDWFLIGMPGTGADEETVKEISQGPATPQATPTTPTPGRSKTVGRSTSNASVVSRSGAVRRHASTASRHSRQSNGTASPASPAYPTLGIGVGVHRSNTVPSKKSPGLPGGRMVRPSASPATSSMEAAVSANHAAPTQDVIIPLPTEQKRDISPAAGSLATTGAPSSSGLAPSTSTENPGRSQERLLGPQYNKQETATPQKEAPKEQFLSSLFSRSPTEASEKRQPNKLKKKRVVSGSSNPSAQSSTNSLHAGSNLGSPRVNAMQGSDVIEHSSLANSSTDGPSGMMIPEPLLEEIKETETSIPNESRTKPNEPAPAASTEESHPSAPAPEPAPAPKSDRSSARSPARSHSSMYQSEQDLGDMAFDAVDSPTVQAEKAERRRRWRLSRRQEGRALSASGSQPPLPQSGAHDVQQKTIDENKASPSADPPRKSFSALDATHRVGGDAAADVQSSGREVVFGESAGSPGVQNTENGGRDEKKGPIDWLKQKLEERRGRDADKERSKKSLSVERTGSEGFGGGVRGKSVDAIVKQGGEGVGGSTAPMGGGSGDHVVQGSQAATTTSSDMGARDSVAAS